MADEYWLGQTILVTATLTDPAAAEAPTDQTGETLTAWKPDGSNVALTSTAHPSVGIYTGQVMADQVGFWQVNDAKGGVYVFYVKPIRTSP